MMRHSQSAFAKRATWLSNNWPSILRFLAQCGLPACHAQRGSGGESLLNEPAISEFGVIPLLARWFKVLPDFSGGRVANNLLGCLLRIVQSNDLELDIVVDETFQVAFGAEAEGQPHHSLVVMGGRLFWDDDEETPALLRQALFDLLGYEYSGATEDGLPLADLLRCMRVERKEWRHTWFCQQIFVHLGLLLRQSILMCVFPNDPFALASFLVKRQEVNWNVIAGMQEAVASLSKPERRSKQGRRLIAMLRARLFCIDHERYDNMKYYMAARLHFSEVASVSCAVDESRIGCRGTLFGIANGVNETSQEERAVVLPPHEFSAKTRGVIIGGGGNELIHSGLLREPRFDHTPSDSGQLFADSGQCWPISGKPRPQLVEVGKLRSTLAKVPRTSTNLAIFRPMFGQALVNIGQSSAKNRPTLARLADVCRILARVGHEITRYEGGGGGGQGGADGRAGGRRRRAISADARQLHQGANVTENCPPSYCNGHGEANVTENPFS